MFYLFFIYFYLIGCQSEESYFVLVLNASKEKGETVLLFIEPMNGNTENSTTSSQYTFIIQATRFFQIKNNLRTCHRTFVKNDFLIL